MFYFNINYLQVKTMNKIELVQEAIEKLELEIENLLSGVSDWATMYNVDSKEDAEQILNEELENLQNDLQNEIDKATYYDIYNENLNDIYN